MAHRASHGLLTELGTALGSCALDLARLGLLDVVRRNPFGVKRGRSTSGSGVYRRNIFGFLGSSRLLGIASLSTALLREVWCNPDSVEEVHDTSKEREDEEVKEDASNN